jgi:hypothetical protein
MLRAEYLAQSGIELAKLLVAVQSGMQNMLQSLPPEFRDAIVITDYANFLAQAFGGDKESRDALGGMVGIDLGSVEGMGTPKGTSFDLSITSEEGKYPINCGGGYNPTPDSKRNVYLLLDALVRPPRFDRLFGVADRDGVVINREGRAGQHPRLDRCRCVALFARRRGWSQRRDVRQGPTTATSRTITSSIPSRRCSRYAVSRKTCGPTFGDFFYGLRDARLQGAGPGDGADGVATARGDDCGLGGGSQCGV